MPRGSNLPAVAAFNQAVILDGIRRAPDGVSRVELVAATSLSAQTVSNVTRRLIEQGLVKEAGKQIEGPGKPRTMLELEPPGGYAVGVHMDPSVITCVLLDLEGSVVARSSMRTPLTGAADETISTIAVAIRALIATSHVDEVRVLGIGVAAPGPIDAENGIIVRPPLIPSWSDLPLRDALGAATGLPVLIAKDTTAAAVAERWKNAADPSRDFAFLYYGTGVGLGLVLDNDIHTGSSSNAGDIGHILVDREGPLCSCGRRGCFGESVRPLRLVEQAIDLGVMSANAELDPEVVDVLFSRLASAVDRGDADAQSILDRAVGLTAVFITNLANLLDIDRVVFGGPFWGRVRARFLTELPGAIAALSMGNLPHGIQITESVIGEDVAAVGAACLVLDDAFSPHSSQLFIGNSSTIISF